MLEYSAWLAERIITFWEGLTPTITFYVGFTHLHPFLLPGKARRLKQAKEEAQMEVEQYRRERELEFQNKQQAVSLERIRDGTPEC